MWPGGVLPRVGRSSTPPPPPGARRTPPAVPPSPRATVANGLKYYELAEGRGQVAEAGSVVTVHFDCKYRGLDVVSSRSARLLGGNRTLAEVRGRRRV